MTAATFLLRQVHPAFLQDGRLTSAAFRPTPKDQRKLSVYDGDLIAPIDALNHYLGMGLASIGIVSVTVTECHSLDLQVRSTPEVFPEHAEIDFSDLGSSQIDKKGKRLRDFAEERGWLITTVG